jgi:hypothetical protein
VQQPQPAAPTPPVQQAQTPAPQAPPTTAQAPAPPAPPEAGSTPATPGQGALIPCHICKGNVPASQYEAHIMEHVQKGELGQG